MAVLDDPELAADYARVHRSFRQVADEIMLLPLDEQQLVALNKTVEQEQALYELLTAQPRRKRRAGGSAAACDELVDNAHEVLAISYLIADREVLRLRAQRRDSAAQLICCVIFSTAVALTIALALTRYIARPIAELDARSASSAARISRADHGARPGGPAATLGERLDWLRRRLAELEAQKNRFLRHLSHELKTPLTALREGAELLNDQVGGPLAPPQRQVVSIMRDNSVKLQRLIEDLLDYQRALHAAASLAPSRCRWTAWSAKRRGAHELAMQSKGQRLAIDSETVMVEADAEKLRSIIDNLVGNAVKFTPPGGSITVSARAQAGDAVIDVIDSGPGVPPEERESIFDLVLPRARQGERPHRGHRPGPCHRARVRRGARRAHRRGARRQRRALPRHTAAPFGACIRRRRVTTGGKNYRVRVRRSQTMSNESPRFCWWTTTRICCS